MDIGSMLSADRSNPRDKIDGSKPSNKDTKKTISEGDHHSHQQTGSQSSHERRFRGAFHATDDPNPNMARVAQLASNVLKDIGSSSTSTAHPENKDAPTAASSSQGYEIRQSLAKRTSPDVIAPQTGSLATEKKRFRAHEEGGSDSEQGPSRKRRALESQDAADLVDDVRAAFKKHTLTRAKMSVERRMKISNDGYWNQLYSDLDTIHNFAKPDLTINNSQAGEAMRRVMDHKEANFTYKNSKSYDDKDIKEVVRVINENSRIQAFLPPPNNLHTHSSPAQA